LILLLLLKMLLTTLITGVVAATASNNPLNAPSTSPLKWRKLATQDKVRYTYQDFVSEFGGSGRPSSQSRFEANLAAIHAHNAKGLPWSEGVNRFTDLSPGEFSKFKGKVSQRRDPAENHFRYDAGVAAEDLPTSIDWRSKGAVTTVKDQGGCGSCWAFSATESIESAVFMATGTLPSLAPQEFVDCVPNPNSCGGGGGCAGSTEEYGFAWAMIYGMANETAYAYTQTTGRECLLGMNASSPIAVAGISNFLKASWRPHHSLARPLAYLPTHSLASQPALAVHAHTPVYNRRMPRCQSPVAASQLPANDYGSLMQAVADAGPVSISVDASFMSYEQGVFMGCPKAGSNTTTIDHVRIMCLSPLGSNRSPTRHSHSRLILHVARHVLRAWVPLPAGSAARRVRHGKRQWREPGLLSCPQLLGRDVGRERIHPTPALGHAAV
jgi:hypothetical protein